MTKTKADWIFFVCLFKEQESFGFGENGGYLVRKLCFVVQKIEASRK